MLSSSLASLCASVAKILPRPKNKNAPESLAPRRVQSNLKKTYCAASTFFKAGFGICQITPESSALFG
jgi:hypothetical protein